MCIETAWQSSNHRIKLCRHWPWSRGFSIQDRSGDVLKDMMLVIGWLHDHLYRSTVDLLPKGSVRQQTARRDYGYCISSRIHIIISYKILLDWGWKTSLYYILSFYFNLSWDVLQSAPTAPKPGPHPRSRTTSYVPFYIDELMYLYNLS